ncbi:DEAD/DEAH box helicase [Halocatena pleomorpha]|uniref:DEAD/DEAH box helicase n=1 Tax=Halocatena pleomorpha TaxID=1785090 RepID=A0A3P3R6Q7_9EURY|nr:DEAD/DEAH box helicase [Halocatena pleomorpha]RRJ29152.1 DEAD/DEAH box helicase [Halocatena pleomorpha]
MAAVDEDFNLDLDHPLLTPGLLERREYQLQLADTAYTQHTLVCLPTGLGKTTVSLLVTAYRLDACARSGPSDAQASDRTPVSLLLAPTKPLVSQHASFYREALSIPEEEIVVFTGAVSPEDRIDLWDRARVVVATPQVVENDLIGDRIDLTDVVHLTFDECHRATGEYAYNYIAERYHADAADPLVTGMSASPGGDNEEILTVCSNLGLTTVEVMTEDDADVNAFTYQTDVEWERIELPEEVIEIRDLLNGVIEDRLQRLKSIGVTETTSSGLAQRELNEIRSKLQRLIDADKSDGYEGMSAHAEIMRLRRAVELVETQSVESLRRYFERQRNGARSSGASKAAQRFVSDPDVQAAMKRAETYDDLHPKFRRARILLAQTLGINDGERVIVFTESRDTAETLTDFFSNHFETRKFVGQSDTDGSDGMTQTEQQETLDAFRDGAFEVLVSTSVAEEGLDVPEVDLVLFYEPVPKGIRSIQRKGRTGRGREGHVVVLLAEDTRDEAFFWISRREEKRMEEELRSLKDGAGELRDELGPSTAETKNSEGQSDLESFTAVPDGDASQTDSDRDAGVASTASPTAENAVEIVIDQRELDATIARDLSTRDGLTTRLETLDVGDYVLSDRVVVERKSVDDFLDTIVESDRSLFEQIRDATRSYARPILIVEGEQTALFERRNVHPNAIRGVLASLAVDFGISVLYTQDETGTADLLETIARREQEDTDRTVSVHGEKSTKTLTEQQEYVVSAIAEVGPVTATALLEQFGSVEAVMSASAEDLTSVSGVGDVTANRIRDVVGSEYA